MEVWFFFLKTSWALDFNSKLLPPAMCTFQNVLEILGVYIENIASGIVGNATFFGVWDVVVNYWILFILN